MGVHTLVAFVYVPVLLIFLTKTEFGLYQLVGSVISYLALLDFGLATTTTRYYAAYMAKEDRKGKENLLAVSIIVYSAVAALIVAAGLAVLEWGLPLFAGALSESEMEQAGGIFLVMLANACIFVLSLAFKAVVNAKEKFIFAKTLVLGNMVLQPVIVFIVLNFKPDLMALVWTQTICNLAVFLVNIYYCFFRLGVRIKLHKWENKFVKEVLSFSFFIFLLAVLDQMYWRGGQIIAGAFAGSAAVAVYSIAVQLLVAYTGFSYHINNVFLPKISALAAKSDNMRDINSVFIKISRLETIAVTLLFCGFIFYGSKFIFFWVGPAFEQAYFCAALLMAGFSVYLAQSLGIVILQAKNKHAVLSVIYFVLSAASLALSVPLIKMYGVTGCALGACAGLLLGQGLAGNIYYARAGIDVRGFWNNALKIALGVLPAVAAGAAGEWFIETNSIAVLLIKIFLFTCIFTASMWFFVMNDYEKNLIRKPLHLLK